MQVDLIQATPDALELLWTAARTCYSKKTPQELWADAHVFDPVNGYIGVPCENMHRVVDHVIRNRHLSVCEHIVYTFAVSGVSRALLAQYSRHRIGVSLSVQSQRHVTPNVWTGSFPPSIKGNDLQALFADALNQIGQTYERLLQLGAKKEDARFILPGGAATNFVTTLNLRSLMDVYQKRVVEPGAQWEIKEMVTQFADLVCEREPWLWKYFAGLEQEEAGA